MDLSLIFILILIILQAIKCMQSLELLRVKITAYNSEYYNYDKNKNNKHQTIIKN